MANVEIKKISVEVSKECWKKLKILSLNKDVTLNNLIVDILEKCANKKINQFEEI
jgi:macrodomain Ter protein organizer (MatP/YcbG family)